MKDQNIGDTSKMERKILRWQKEKKEDNVLQFPNDIEIIEFIFFYKIVIITVAK